MICGINPGARGGALALVEGSWAEIHDIPFFQQGDVNVRQLAHWLAEPNITHIWIETGTNMHGRGAGTSFRLAYAYGQIRATAILAKKPVSYVSRAGWRAEYNLQARGRDCSLQRAVELYPMLADRLTRNKDYVRADSLLIARYGTRYAAQYEESA